MSKKFIKSMGEERDVTLLNQLIFNPNRFERLTQKELKQLVNELEAEEFKKLRKGTHRYEKRYHKGTFLKMTAKLKRVER